MRLVILLLACLVTVPAFSQPPIIDPDIVTDMLTGKTPEERDRKAWNDLKAKYKDTEKITPQDAIKAYQEFYESKPKLAPSIGLTVTRTIANLYANEVKDPKKAAEIFLWGWDKYKTSPESGELLGSYLKFLNAQQQYEQTIQTLSANWNDLRRNYTHMAVAALEEGVNALKAQNKSDDLVTFITQTFADFPLLIDGSVQYYDYKFYDPLIQTLLDEKRTDEAMSWAKLRFIAAPYDADAIDRASRMLVKVWSAKDPEKKQLDEFAKAQKDAAIANPLQEILLPPLDDKLADATLARLDKGSGGARERNTLYLWLGDDKAAMREAQKWLNTKGSEKTGALEAARVFKAHDLNLLRATAFLKWLKDKEGANPIDEFLKAPEKTVAKP